MYKHYVRIAIVLRFFSKYDTFQLVITILVKLLISRDTLTRPIRNVRL